MLIGAKLAKNISIFCTLLTQGMVVIYFCLRFVEISKIDRKTVEDQTHLTPYSGYFPYNLRKSPIFEITCLGQIFSAYYATVAYSGVDSFIYMLVLHVCGQFKNLRKKLEHLVAEKYGETTPAKFRRELEWIVKRHEHLNWFAKTIEDSFNLLLLIQMLFCTIELCFHGFNAFQILSEPDRENLAVELVFLAALVGFTVIHLYIYCYVGEMLLVQSTDIGITAYEAQWFNVPAKEAKCLLFIIFRSTHPLRLTAGKFGTFSMEMFSNILRTSLGYLSVLLTVTSSVD